MIGADRAAAVAATTFIHTLMMPRDDPRVRARGGVAYVDGCEPVLL
jgi:hypothetical protein